jgi:hypothetical protein
MKLSTTIERRMVDESELRVDTTGSARTIQGYAAMFDSLSLPLGGFQEVIRKGAFKKTLREGDIRALWNHDPNFVLGRKSARTLRLEEDAKGLLSRISPPDTTWANDLMTSIDRGDVSQMSFGFRAVKDHWNAPDAKGVVIRELLEVQLFDVSPVTFPAYPQTEVHVRAVMDAVLSRMQSGESITTEERAAMALALEQLRGQLLEPGAPHSESQSTTEPGLPHSEEGQRTLQARRLRLLELVG